MKSYIRVQGLNDVSIGLICDRSRNVTELNRVYNTYLELGIEEEFTDINYKKERNPE